MKKTELVSLIYSVMDQINELLPNDQKLLLSEDTALYGTEGQLDSLGMVNFIVALEHKIEQRFGKLLVLINETTMSQQNSPFQTVASLSDYIQHLLSEQE